MYQLHSLSCKRISIHALVKRATCSCRLFIYRFFYFNPRPREEGDTMLKLYAKTTKYFNPRPREEGDRLL